MEKYHLEFAADKNGKGELNTNMPQKYLMEIAINWVDSFGFEKFAYMVTNGLGVEETKIEFDLTAEKDGWEIMFTKDGTKEGMFMLCWAIFEMFGLITS